jgi:FkbM family methyltransferase
MSNINAFPAKKISLMGHKHTVYGISKTDPYFNGLCDNYEADFLSLCDKILSKDSVCIDIGANIGIKSLYMSDLAYEGKIISIEAAPGIAKALKQNAEANQKDMIVIIQTAIGDSEGDIGFVENSSAGRVDLSGEISSVPVKMTTLPKLVKQLGLDRIDFIKIDVEGFEEKILKSSLDLINSCGSLVLFEFNSFCQLAYGDVNPSHFLDWVFKNFSSVFLINKGKSDWRRLLTPLCKDKKVDFLHQNLVFDGCVSDLLVTNNPAWLPRLQRLSEKYVSRQDVVDAYKFILGREPDNEAVVEARVGKMTFEELRNEFLSSQEFADMYKQN